MATFEVNIVPTKSQNHDQPNKSFRTQEVSGQDVDVVALIQLPGPENDCLLDISCLATNGDISDRPKLYQI